MPTPLFQHVEFDFEEWRGPSPTFRAWTSGYKRWPATRFNDRAADLTDRQANYYRNLVNLALATKTNDIPVDMILPNGSRLWMDHGCIKIAEHAGFIETLRNEDNGLVGSIRVAWRVIRSDN